MSSPPAKPDNSRKNVVTKTPAATAQSIANSPLFTKLPPELRNRVYEYALYTEGTVWIKKEGGIPEPPLLLTCRTVRKEAIGIFYQKNRIRKLVVDFDPSTEILMHSKANSLLRQYGFNIWLLTNDSGGASVHRKRAGSRNWKNLLSWLQAFYRHQALGLVHAERSQESYAAFSEERKLLAGLFYVVIEMAEKPWSDIEFVVSMLRPGLVACNPQWSVG